MSEMDSDMDLIFSGHPELGTIDDVILTLNQNGFWPEEFLQRAIEHEKKRYARQGLNKLGYVSVRTFDKKGKPIRIWKHKSALTERELKEFVHFRLYLAQHFEAAAAEAENRLRDFEPPFPDHPPKCPANQKRRVA